MSLIILAILIGIFWAAVAAALNLSWFLVGCVFCAAALISLFWFVLVQGIPDEE